MRVTERGPTRNESARRGDFQDALRRARDEGALTRRAGDGERAAAHLGARRTAMRAEAQAATRARGLCEEERGAAPAADPAGAGLRPPEVERAPELSALARALPLAVAAAGVRDGAPLALAFGRSLDVELRSGSAGVEILLRPEPRLERAAQLELPSVVSALRTRGISVARAEVRTRGGRAR